MHATYLADIRRTYRNYRQLAERAIAQVSDAQLATALDTEDNSIAVIMRHVCGNLQSRFRDLLTRSQAGTVTVNSSRSRSIGCRCSASGMRPGTWCWQSSMRWRQRHSNARSTSGASRSSSSRR